MERNYEIRELKHDGNIYKLSNFKYEGERKFIKDNNPNSFCTKKCLIDYPSEVKVYSIRRKSDNEIFTIGDLTRSGKIFKINIRDGVISFYHGPNSGPNLYLDEIQKFKWESKEHKEQAYLALYQGKMEISDYLQIINPYKDPEVALDKVWHDCVLGFPLTPDECYPTNYNLLLLCGI